MAPPNIIQIAIICFFCCCLLPAATLASQLTTTTLTPVVFHVTPQTVVNSVLSNIRQHCRPFLDVDVSCSNLDDDAVISLVEGILDKQDATAKTETVLNLKLDMNRITPTFRLVKGV